MPRQEALQAIPGRPAPARPWAGPGGRQAPSGAGAALAATFEWASTPRWARPLLPLDLLPLGDPLVVGRAVVAAAVDALLLRRCPVVDLGGIVGVGGVEDVAEVLLGGVITGLRLRGRLPEVLGHLCVDLRRGDPVHPLVHAVRMRR